MQVLPSLLDQESLGEACLPKRYACHTIILVSQDPKALGLCILSKEVMLNPGLWVRSSLTQYGSILRLAVCRRSFSYHVKKFRADRRMFEKGFLRMMLGSLDGVVLLVRSCVCKKNALPVRHISR